jgi:hypothetical protein
MASPDTADVYRQFFAGRHLRLILNVFVRVCTAHCPDLQPIHMYGRLLGHEADGLARIPCCTVCEPGRILFLRSVVDVGIVAEGQLDRLGHQAVLGRQITCVDDLAGERVDDLQDAIVETGYIEQVVLDYHLAALMVLDKYRKPADGLRFSRAALLDRESI